MGELERATQILDRLRAALEAELVQARGQRLLMRSLDTQGLFARARQRGAFNVQLAQLEQALGEALEAAGRTLGLSQVTLVDLRLAVPEAAQRLGDELKRRFEGRLNIHSLLAPNYGVTIVEAFSPDADKFKAVVYVAQAHKIAPGAIAAVGDDVNDLPMIRGVKLGVAMPQSPPAVQQAASHVARGGLVEFLRQLLAGKFD